MKAEHEVLACAVQAKVPVIIWGPPGVGKTATVQALGRALGLPTEVVIASVREPSDFAGLPVVVNGTVRLAPPTWARRLADAGEGLLFLDEISTAPPAVQAALLRVVLDRVVGDLALPDGVAVVAAANPPEQAAGGWDLSAPLANRFLHLTWSVDAAAWAEGMLTGFPTPQFPRLPEGWRAGVAATRALVAGFVRARPQLLLAVPDNEAAAGKAWPSPRSWDLAATMLAAVRAAGLGPDAELLAVGGCVGEGTAVEFAAYCRDLDLPDPEQVLRHPEGFKLPARGDQAYAALGAVVAAALRDLTPERWVAAWDVLYAAAQAGATDVAAACAGPLARAIRPGLPLPSRQLQPFMPLLRAAGLIA
jgi:hypothetical protein